MIYLIKGGDKCKIGVTSKPINKRLRELQIGSPVLLDLVATAEGSFLLEKYLHEKFSEIRSHGEWFFWSEDIVLEFEKINSGEVDVSAFMADCEAPVPCAWEGCEIRIPAPPQKRSAAGRFCPDHDRRNRNDSRNERHFASVISASVASLPTSRRI